MTSHTKLLIVESPVKARTIEKYLKGMADTYVVRATKGHLADIPDSADGVDVESGFVPRYELTKQGREIIAELRRELRGVDEVILATDPDREGELIAAHVVEFLAPSVPVARVVFHSVTKDAVLGALENPRSIDAALVEAAKTRRILDRLYGYRVTEVGRRLIRPNVTAGRVQSPALRLVVERELARLAFVPATYCGIAMVVAGTAPLEAELSLVDGARVAAGKDFTAQGVVTGDVVVLHEAEAADMVRHLAETGSVTVADVSDRAARRKPPAPFIMSSLQQEAFNKLGMAVSEVERLAQRLFDASHITYARTDNPVHSAESRQEIRAFIAREFGVDSLSVEERFTSSKKKLAQGAHEAIRPTRLSAKSPDGVTGRELDLYRLIWRRTVASQMNDATGTTRTIRLQADAGARHCEFAASFTVLSDPGFRVVFDDGENRDEATLPPVVVGESLKIDSVSVAGHVTQPPARFTEASLVRELEERGIGRPSTYGKIIRKLRDRYVWTRPGERALIPTLTSFAVFRLLTEYFSLLVEDDFTSAMEDDLERIADGGLALRDAVLEEFFFGGREWPGLQALVELATATADVGRLHVVDVGVHPRTGEPVVVRPGRMRDKTFSPYIECGSQRVSIADETALDELSLDRAVSLLDAKEADTRLLGVDPPTGLSIIVRPSRGGKGGHYLQIGDRGELKKGAKPRFVSVPNGIDAASLDIAAALEIIAAEATRRRLVGVHPEGGEIWAILGQYGPYVTWKKENRSLPDGDDIGSVSLDRAVSLLSAPKPRRRRRPTPSS